LKVEKERREEEETLTPFQRMLADRARRLEQVIVLLIPFYCAISPF
jgi:hypothetical protein